MSSERRGSRRWGRRRVLTAGVSVAGLSALAGCTAPSGDDTDTRGEEVDADEGGTTHEVLVGPDGEFVYTPGTEEPLEINPGDTVRWLWESDAHNINPEDVPADAEWEGQIDLEDTGFEHEHTFEVEGGYHYVCDPHVDQGMVADLVVGEADADAAGDDDREDEEEDAEELYSFDDPVDATGQDVVEIETREGDDAEGEPSFVFDPHHVRVDEGATIEWVNTDGIFHTVTSTDDIDTRQEGGDTFDATISNEGDTFEWNAEGTGSQPYYCSPHAGFMFGQLEIE